MKKKVNFLIVMLFISITNLSAQFTADNIQFWVGQGSNSAILNVDFIVDGEQSSFAWGYHFDGATSGAQMLADISAADNQLVVNAGDYLNDIFYQEFEGVAGTPTYWSTWTKSDDASNWMTNLGIGTEVVDGQWFGCSYTLYDADFNPINEPSEPVAAEEETVVFTQEDIMFWVGEGANSAILNVDFIVDGEQSSFAWGFHFDGTTTGTEILGNIADADEYFTVNMGEFLNDIFYQDYDGVAGNPTFWSTWTKSNDEAAWILNSGLSTVINDGEWFGCSYTLYDDEFNPINEPGYPLAAININPQSGPYAPGADEPGTTAIPAESILFSSWANDCVVERGSMNISDPDAEDASYGTEIDATGIADGLSVISLGDGGSAILTFLSPIVNGEGYDFAVFENGFADNFLELAFVEVSSHGVNYYRFPSSSLTQTEDQIGGFGEIDPTFIHNLAGKYRSNFGTPFDLNDLAGTAGLDLNAITHIKIIDVVGSINPLFGSMDTDGNMINDPFTTEFESGGFDLDAVGVINTAVSVVEKQFDSIKIYPNPANQFLTINSPISGKFNIIDQAGKVCLSNDLEGSLKIDISNLSSGIYVVNFVSKNMVSNTVLVVE